MSLNNQHPGSPIASHRFVCCICGETAGVVELLDIGNGFEIDRSGVTGRMECRVGANDVERLSSAIVSGDVRLLHAHDFEITPFYCPTCGMCYCAAHWKTQDIFDEGFHDCIRGTCPKGHERMLED